MSRFEHEPIQRHPGMQPFSRDHYVGLVHAQRLIKAAEGDAAARRGAIAAFLDAWDHEISAHFKDEERLLIPLMRQDDAGRLLREHEALRRMAREARDLRKQIDPAASWVREAGERLRDHIRWEERELFGRIEAETDEAALAKLAEETGRIEASRPRNTCRDSDEG